MEPPVPAALLVAMRTAGAVFDRRVDGIGPARFRDTPSEYRAVRERAGVLWRCERAAMLIAGTERTSWLQGMVTNDVTVLDRGSPAVSACLLSATGHVLADLVIARLGDTLLLDAPLSAMPAVLATLDRLIVMEDVTLDDASAGLTCLSVQGPAAGDAAARALIPPETLLIPADHTGCGGIDCWVPVAEAAAAWSRLAASGAAPVGRAAAETLRIQAGIPRFGVDFDETTIPLEAGLEATHISYEKGCYVGQEIIARIHSRGHTNRALTGLMLLGGARLPELRAKVVDPSAGGREVGWVTSATLSPTLQGGVALAFVRHESREPGTLLRVAAARGTLDAMVSRLPFGPQPPCPGTETPTNA